jgi:hypothetical protein
VSVELTRIPDTDPAPPFTIAVHTIFVTDNGYTRMLGIVHNDSAETYEGAGVHASFVDREGRGHGPVDVFCPSPFLVPGAECPFALEIYGTDYVAYRVHPRGFPAVSGQPAPLGVRVISVFSDAVGNVRITGVAANGNPFGVKRGTVVGTLLDREGDVVSLGWTLLFDDLPAGASEPFDVRIDYEPYSRYRVYGQGARD